MRRRDKTGGKATQRPKTLKRRDAPKVARRRGPSAVDAQRIALLTRQRDEALQQQTATADVLKVISRSTFDLQMVLDTLVESSARLCEAYDSVILLHQGEWLRIGAHHGPIPLHFADWPIERGWVTGRAFVDRVPIHVHDLQASAHEFPDGAEFALRFGHRTILAVPLLRDDEAIGALMIRRTEVKPFTDKQIELATAFADQAVIAIENTRLLNELRQRTDDLTESLERQTATSEVLKVISSSPGELEPVFNAMLESAVRLCEAKLGTLFLSEGKDSYRTAALYGAPPAFAEARRKNPVIKASPGAGLGRVAATKEPVQILDIRNDPAYTRDPSRAAILELAGARTMLNVPMLKDNDLVGQIGIYRQEVRSFTDKQIELVKNFAAQAVIAIENARLLNELREALEQQTATSEVLKVISSSPSDLQPVFQSMLDNSVRICEAKFGQMFLCKDDKVRVVAYLDVPAALVQWDKEQGAFQPSFEGGLMRAIRTKNVIHIDDFMSEHPSNPVAKLGGARSYIAVPMLKENELVGVIVIYRQEVRPFTEKQIELVKNFATQAVIAIENARLLNDLNKLNQQLEQRVTDQVSEIERMGKLRRFLPAQVADLIVPPGRKSNSKATAEKLPPFSAICAALQASLRALIRKT